MKHRQTFGGLTMAAFAVLTVPVAGSAQRFVGEEDATYRYVQYADSLYSLNDRCIVRMRPLSLSLPPVYVNGLPIGFC